MFDRKRETVYVVDDEARPRWLAIHGGKLTGWRAAAEAVLERLEPSLPPARRKADTRTLRLPPDPEGTRVELATGAGFDD
jgi:glycerol-3-phosphate dehydrogenase